MTQNHSSQQGGDVSHAHLPMRYFEPILSFTKEDLGFWNFTMQESCEGENRSPGFMFLVIYPIHFQSKIVISSRMQIFSRYWTKQGMDMGAVGIADVAENWIPWHYNLFQTAAKQYNWTWIPDSIKNQPAFLVRNECLSWHDHVWYSHRDPGTPGTWVEIQSSHSWFSGVE